ncbi:crotonobetainyl-CoA:carnitine CoA-transferase CaiB-like acyl-CoA transferase [Pseudarthrobacter defluvii]|uniref:CoA transferase n=1 Tax=Pseudarthrobacter defluvii TaxID=410837 RepID=UPI002786005B|nr:CoA transferase [Pseudarthrobacter defluvii]MDQ0770864.1 crotonobetainyl-CoA:carnitine CoA-transferase CaiB-like acyl-CoA transferase [Pseudarthrobacter defluvii]
MDAAGTYSPRRWWAGPLDVEGLALHSVEAVAAALNLYAGTPGRFTTTAALTAAAFDSFGHLRIAGRKPEGFAALSGFRRTRDGWIRLHANYPHHEQRLLQALDATSAEGAERQLRSMAALEAETAIQSLGGIAAAVRTRSQWLDSDMGRAAESGPWIAFDFADGATAGLGLEESAVATATAYGTGVREGLPLDHLPLGGLRMLDLTRVIAGPVATRLLAALGADVLRIDPPAFPEIEDQFVDTAFGKRSAEADLALPGSQQELRRLLAAADVVVTGYRHGALDRFGLNPRELLATHPGLAVVTLNSWGRLGPWSALRGFDSIVQAACGIADLYGKENDDGEWRPGALPVQALDHATGYGVAAAAIRILARRRETGTGGAAYLSLARTAEELFSLGNNTELVNNTEKGNNTENSRDTERGKDTASPSELPGPGYRFMDSAYGLLRYVGPPLMNAGQPLDYLSPPPPYGGSPLVWA